MEIVNMHKSTNLSSFQFGWLKIDWRKTDFQSTASLSSQLISQLTISDSHGFLSANLQIRCVSQFSRHQHIHRSSLSPSHKKRHLRLQRRSISPQRSIRFAAASTSNFRFTCFRSCILKKLFRVNMVFGWNGCDCWLPQTIQSNCYPCILWCWSISCSKAEWIFEDSYYSHITKFKYDINRVDRWNRAMTELGNLVGFDVRDK